MTPINTVIVLVLFIIQFGNSQDSDQVLMTIDQEPIKVSEFLNVYNKNLDLVKDESQKDIDNYLKLFIEYQLKLKEAKRLNLDKTPKYKREFNTYKKQLVAKHLSDHKVTDQLIEEAYERMKIDINASHALVRIDPSATDTLTAYNTILDLRKRLLNEGFDELKRKAHDGKSIFIEDLGYFSTFKMVYDFETAAYNTEVGEVSMPFRTQFGYHVVYVKDKRPSKGTISAAHIMVSDNNTNTKQNPQQRITDIYAKYKQGESFEALAKQFSDDKSSAGLGGKLAPFKSGQLSSKTFEDVAFNLDRDGAVSEPFQTAFGWHIVKRINLEPLQPLEKIKPTLQKKIKRDSRSKVINKTMVAELKQRYTIKQDNSAIDYFVSILSEDFFKNTWKLPENFESDKVLFEINNTKYTYAKFGEYLLSSQRRYANNDLPLKDIVISECQQFLDKTILQFREDNLVNENKAYAEVLTEYRNGLLLFDLMEKEIWNKASEDTLGLAQYFKENASNYRWNQRIDSEIASSADLKIIKSVKQLMEEGKDSKAISKALNTEKKQNVIFTNEVLNADDPRLPNKLKIKKGISKVYKHNEAFHVIKVKQVLPRVQKTFEEAKGAVVANYQNYLERSWMTTLKNRYKVSIDKPILESLKSKFNQE